MSSGGHMTCIQGIMGSPSFLLFVSRSLSCLFNLFSSLHAFACCYGVSHYLQKVFDLNVNVHSQTVCFLYCPVHVCVLFTSSMSNNYPLSVPYMNVYRLHLLLGLQNVLIINC